MRLVLALCILTALCVQANAASKGRHTNPRHVITRPGTSAQPVYITPSGARIFRDDRVPGGFRTDHDDPPAYDDPSKFGGA